MPAARRSSTEDEPWSSSQESIAHGKATPPAPLHHFPDSAAWERWLEEHHTTSGFIWVQFIKAASAKEASPPFTYAQALEIALCFGWIDGQTRRLDDHSWAQKFGPRGPRSIWSVRNRTAAQKLMEEGRMRPAGHTAIERAQANGAWESAYHGPSKSTVPEDLQSALDAHPAAAAFFKTLSSQNRYAILFRLQTAKKPETRQARLKKFLQMLLESKTLH